MNDAQARCAELIERCLGYSNADEVRVSVSQEDTSQLRFARNTITTSARIENLFVSVRSSFGSRSASASSNLTDPDSLRSLVRQAESLARLMPEDPEAMGELGPMPLPPSSAPELESEAERMANMASGAAHCIAQAREASLIAAGFLQAQSGVRALGTSAGFGAAYPFAEAHFSTTVRTPDGTGSGWNSSAAPNAAGLDFKGGARVAIEKARRSARPGFLAPTSMSTILEPACVASLLRLLLGGLGARPLDEGRSPFKAKDLDARLFPSLLSVHSNPFDPSVPVQPWSAEGLPHGKCDWIKAGSLRSLACGRYWARKSGRQARPPAPNAIMLGGHKSLTELVATSERALLVTNLWYMRQVDARSMLYTGLTRDGVFLVENGEIVRPVNNFRWNDSPIRIFQAIEELSRSVRVGGRGGATRNFVVPAMKVDSFQLSSISEAV